ncbi:MAG: ammonia-forming cytochrome c nitrite reductase subunit c552, partial [Bacteroidota bacterium]
ANGVGFHSPLEAARVLGSAIEKAQEARTMLARVLAKRGRIEPIPLPDISTKEKAQRFIGLNMSELHAKKAEFLRTVVPLWDKAAAERQAALPAY